MIMLLLSAVLFIIQPAGGRSQHDQLVPNVIVVEKELQTAIEVPLRCGGEYEGMDISWRREGSPLPKRGNHINVTVEEMMGGNFTCHDSAGAVLNHQLLLVQLSRRDNDRRILEKTDGDYIKCLSRNYSGIFHCSWNWSPNRVGTVVHVSAQRSSNRDNITCTVDENESGITCLDQFQCSYAEELDYITLSVHIRYMYRLEKYTSQFSISEIVKPDKVSITKLSGNTFEMEYPSTWSLPKSYFPLTFHIKVMPLRKGGDCSNEQVQGSRTQNRTVSVGNRREFRLCVRAQDELCNSSWSDWSFYEVKRR
ncbi:interleukin-12 subunit beta-like [Anguilla rostrata]|uniref:interleukin-12 subunit beta-like n=1 Tax=Anguilla rostrata TaxID=7938 RepID=UPI0030D38B62